MKLYSQLSNEQFKFTLSLIVNRLQGNLVYEYHPFRNYVLETKVRQTSDEGFYIPEGGAINKRTGELLTKTKDGEWIDKDEMIIQDSNVITYENCDYIGELEENSLEDLDTNLLNFDINHPVELEIQPSYDGSVNVILNDNKNITRLINSRFSAREKNTYEIVDRIGENTTNIYSLNSFDRDTSLYFLCGSNPIIKFLKLISGRLAVGLYCFYITYCDADDNESDIVAETGVIPVFIGADGDKKSMDGGIKNQLSDKGIQLKITKLDSSYNYIKVYYVRYFADYLLTRVYEGKKLYKRISIQNNTELEINITGIENLEDIDPNSINITKFNASSVLTQALCKNMLFFGNIHKNVDNYKELSDCALKIIPNLTYTNISNYENKYYDTRCTYNYTGYWNEEYYRFGVVFIYNNGTLSNVYNTLGLVCCLAGAVEYKNESTLIFKENKNEALKIRNYLSFDEEGWIDSKASDFFKFKGSELNLGSLYLNSKGVCKIKSNVSDTTHSIGINFTISNEIISYLKNRLGIRGLFFVRLKRVPNIIALCMILPIDKELEAPIIYAKDLNNVNNFLVESFLFLKIVGTIENETNGEDSSEGYKENLLNSSYLERLITYIDAELVTSDENKNNKLNKGISKAINDYKKEVERIIKELRGEISENGNSSGENLSNIAVSIALKENISNKAYAGICPDFLLNLPYYNQIFNGSTFILKKVKNNEILKRSNYTPSKFGNYNTSKESIGNRLYTMDNDNNETEESEVKVKIVSVTENVNVVSLEDQVYRLNIGEGEVAYKFRLAGNSLENIKDDDNYHGYAYFTNAVRGVYSPYLAMYVEEGKLDFDGIYNIYKDESSNDRIRIKERMNLAEPYYSISDRFNFEDGLVRTGYSKYEFNCFRGDFYFNTFTYRLNRNFNDPSLPNNDVIIDPDTFAYYFYGQDNKEHDLLSISRSDINAVTLGSWIQFNVCSSFNYAYRSEDNSYVSEKAIMGSPRTYYPRVSKPWIGNYKMSDSYLYNDAFRATLGFKCYFTLEDVNYLKNVFSNRIQYSEIAILDSYKNNYRDSKSTYFRDYSSEYGAIMRLIEMDGYLLVVFEHAIGIAVINERIIASNEGAGNPVFINTNNVLPEELTIISNTYGTQWPESVVKSEKGIVYGVDTVAKKIWRVLGLQIEIISDEKVNGFLTNNITLSERELTPIVGIKNVKSHYNNNKKDVMFTFYDDVYKDEEKVWNLCFNELLNMFSTFYSWIPSYSENIDTQYFSFDRKSSKDIALLWKSNYYIKTNYGVLVENPILDDETIPNNFETTLYYREKSLENYTIINRDGTSTSYNIPIKQEYYMDGISFRLENDHWGNYKKFIIQNGNTLKIKDGNTTSDFNDIIYLVVTPYKTTDEDIYYYKSETIALSFKSKFTIGKFTQDYFKTDFYLHGLSGIIDVKDPLLPCFWYEKQHPFEFEFVVTDKLGQQKIFNNLVIISNKAEPESFHFEIEGDNYEFSKDKRTMYFRQERTKLLYQTLGSDILYDRNYKESVKSYYTREQYYYTDNVDYSKLDKVYPIEKEGLVKLSKSTIFPLYYERIDNYEDVYYNYHLMDGGNTYDFKNLSGSEIKYNERLNLFNIVTHIKNSPIDKVGRMRGNSTYTEGKWNIQIPSINFVLKNENDWVEPPIVINSLYVPNDITTVTITPEIISNIITGRKERVNKNVTNLSDYIESSNGWTQRKEAAIRDKFIKIRVRYSGKNLAVIHSLITLYNLSYS